MKLITLLMVALAVLPPQPAPRPVPDFNRSEWGRWMPTAEHGANGCTWDTRHLVLRRDAVEATTREVRGKACRVLTVTFVEPYTGERLALPATKVDVDHIVPLAEANRSGGWAWSADKRLAYYNDLRGLVATSARTNRAKGDRDPAEWMPEVGRCEYARTWIAIKERWQLTSDEAEVKALGRALEECR